VIRVIYAVVLLLCLLMVYSESSFSQDRDIAFYARLSSNFFTTFSYLQLILVLGLGPAMAAGTIAVERERRTIEYLFASQLSNAEIVLGKLFARLMQVAYLTLVGLPILALAMLMGGIAPESLVMLFLVTLGAIFTVAILSITVSVWSARSREAVVRAYLLVFVWLALPPLLLAFNFTLRSTVFGTINEELLATNPFWVFTAVLDLLGRAQADMAWDILGTMARNQGIVCLAGVIASTLAVRRVHLKQRGEGTKKPRFRFQWLRPRIGDRPMIWKEFFAEPAASKLGWLGYILMGIILLAVLGITAYAFYDNVFERPSSFYGRNFEGYLVYTTVMTTILSCGCLLLIAARAASSITSEKERDCWISLLSTPLTPGEIVWAKVSGNLYAARWFLGLLAMLWGLAVMLVPIYIGAVLLQAATFAILAFFASSMGVLYSLWCKTSMKAMAATVATGIFVGGGYLFCCAFCMILNHGGSGHEEEIMFAGVMPFLLAFPSFVFIEPGGGSATAKTILAAYVLGMLFYGIMGPVLFGMAIANFESLTGRVGGFFVPHRPGKKATTDQMPSPLQEPIVVEAVEE
jgi:ABC-type transport system involved in multi-copper enzyme maturation permease subunit